MAASFLAVLNHMHTQWYAIGIYLNDIQQKRTENYSKQNPKHHSIYGDKMENL